MRKRNEDNADEKELTLGQELKSKRVKETRGLKFIRTRMWVSTLMSKFFTDRGTIPKNIGNNILVANNVYITKNHISALIQVSELSEVTPVAWAGDLQNHVKDQCAGVLVDVIMKNVPYYVNTSQSGIESRIRTWQMTLDNPLMPKEVARRAARCLYSVDVIKSGARIMKSRVYIRVMSKTNRELMQGISAVLEYLHSIDATAKRIESNIDEHLAYTIMMSNKKPEHLKDLPAVVFSTQTLAESMPATQGYNSTKGQLVGYDTISNYPYLIDFRKTANAKNILIEAASGFGKTYVVEWWLHPFLADEFCQCIMDIKGTEFTGYTKQVGGLILSMRADSTYYINNFVWDAEDLGTEMPDNYAKRCMRMAKEKMCIMSEMEGRDLALCEALLDEFLDSLYMSIGALSNNVGTWHRTKSLTPYIVYDMFIKYLSNEIMRKYGNIAVDLKSRLGIFMSRNGSSSHMFRNAMSYKDFLDSQCITFDFGIIEGANEQSPVMFKLHVLDMVTINNAYVSSNKKKGKWTVKVLEESQVAADYLLKIYKDEVTLRRAQNQITILLGNSVTALMENPLSKPIMENMNVLVLGKLNKTSRGLLVQEFDLTDMHESYLEEINKDPDRMHTFLLVNRMEKNATTALLQTLAPTSVTNSSTFKVVDTVDSN